MRHRGVKLCLLCLAASLAACSPRYVVDPLPAWDACLKSCTRDDETGRLIRRGCLQGCEMALEAFPFTGSVYAGQHDCEAAVARYGVEGKLRMLEARCMEEGTQVHRRRGCRDGVRTFYGHLTPAMCIGAAGPAAEAAPSTGYRPSVEDESTGGVPAADVATQGEHATAAQDGAVMNDREGD